MKALILYKPSSEHDTPVQGYVREFFRRTGKKLELVDVETREGISKAALYDVLQFPTLIAIRDDGEFIEKWPELERWPTMNELTYYTQQS